jgi:hypothetical protein
VYSKDRVWRAAVLAANSSNWTASRIDTVTRDAWGTYIASAVVYRIDDSADSRGLANKGKEFVLRAAFPAAAETGDW